jgi:D-aminopeptidase
MMVRARELGIVIGYGSPGAHNAISDVAGVRVGYTTLIEGLDVRTGVTVILPFDRNDALFAGAHRLNGCGEMTGLQWVRESGMLTSPIAITNTHSIGAVHEGLIAAGRALGQSGSFFPFDLPVVAETWDGRLNDANSFHVRPEHVQAAITGATNGPIAEGNVGGGTGMVCHGFKGGTGTASRIVEAGGPTYTVGVLVQANHGQRARLQVNGVPVGLAIPPSEVPLPSKPEAKPEVSSDGQGSIIVVVATDAPLLPVQCERLAQRAGLGIARTGGLGENGSGDLFIAFATGNRGLQPAADPQPVAIPVQMLNNASINPLFEAVVEATEEAILNALLAAETLTGAGGMTAYRLPPGRLVEVMARFGRPPL